MRESGKEMRGMEKMKGERRLKRWLRWVTKGVRKRVSKEEKKKGRREGGEACMAQQYTIINLTESV